VQIRFENILHRRASIAYYLTVILFGDCFNDSLPSTEMNGDVKARCCEVEYGGNGRTQQVVVQ